MRETPQSEDGRHLSGGARFPVAFILLLMLLAASPAEGFDLQGHRGARGLMPENSLPTFEKALALGVTTLELDVVMTADGVVVVHHDRRLAPQRTRDAAGAWIAEANPQAIIDLTAAEVASYDIGRGKPGSRYAQDWPEQVALDGVRIPTLAAVLARAETLSGGAVRYNIEVKTAPDSPADSADPTRFARALVAVIREAGVGIRVTVQSFDWRALRAVQQAAPEIATAYLTAERDWLDTLQRGAAAPSPWLGGLAVDWAQSSVPQAVRRAGGTMWSPYFGDLSAATLTEAQRLGLRVVVWTVNDPADMAALIDLGVDGFITDYPDRARAVMAKKGVSLPPAFPGD